MELVNFRFNNTGRKWDSGMGIVPIYIVNSFVGYGWDKNEMRLLSWDCSAVVKMIATSLR